MINFITKVAGKIDDPIMQEWAVYFYRDLPDTAEREKSQIETFWFHDLFITQLINGEDSSLLGLYFRELPPQCFSKHTHLIVKNWAKWSSSLITSAVDVLAVNAPNDLIQLFENDLALLKTEGVDPLRFLAIDRLPTDGENSTVVDLTNDLSLIVLALSDNFSQSFLIHPLIKQCKLLPFKTIHELVDLGLQNESSDKRRQRYLHSLFDGLFGSDEYLELVLSRENFDSPLKLSTLTPFFIDSAPLEQIDDWLDARPQLSEIMILLESISSDDGRIILELIKCSKKLSEKNKSQLALAACLHCLSKDTIDVSTFDLTQTVSLLAIDLEDSRWTKILIEHLRVFEQAEIIPLLIDQLEGNDSYFSAVYAAEAMGVLQYTEFIDPLINAIDDDGGDFLCDVAQESLLKIGLKAQARLIIRWGNLDASQRIFGLNVIRIIQSEMAIDFVISRFPELMSFGLEAACELLVTSPSLRLLELLKPELRRKQNPIDRAFYISAKLLNYDGGEVDAVKERVLKDFLRGRQAMANLALGHAPQNEHLTLELKCPACDSVNKYSAQGVVVAEDVDVPFLLADEFPCVSCNKDVDFIFMPMVSMAVSAELMISATNKGDDFSQPPKVKMLNCQLEGKILPIATAMSLLKKDLSNDPSQGSKWFQLGKLLSEINRPKASIDAYQMAVNYAPTSVDAKLLLAVTLSNNEQDSEAFSVLESGVDKMFEWTFFSDFPDFNRAFADFYNHLRLSLGKTDIPVLHPSALCRPKKTGRNEPCSCGSGKKYKKCCG